MANTFKFGNGQWAVKDGYALAYNDENGNFKPLPFDFTRASSATRVNKDGLIETVGSNKPRIDFLNDSNGALLLEPTRSNLIVNSQALSLSPIKNGTFTDDFAISPDGTQNATKFTAPSSDPYFYQSVSFAAASYTASIYVKGIGSSIGKDFRIVLGGLSSYPKLIIPSEWTRFEYTATMSSGSFNAGLEIPDPAVSGDEVLIWGWQVEQGSYPTSYIPTQGSAVTRVAETCTGAGNNQVINSTEGVVYCEIASLVETPETRSVIGISVAGSGDDRVTIEYNTGDTNIIKGQVRTSSLQGSISYTVTSTKDFHKVALVYQLDNVRLWIDGVKVGQDLIANVSSPNTISIAAFLINNTNNFYGKCKGFRIYDTVLTDAELQALTT
jgi:hypothetical protein